MPRQFTHLNDPEIATLLRAGAVGVVRTDTLYGLVSRADNEQAVERIYTLKDRDTTKSPIVLISDQTQLFSTPNTTEQRIINSVWPGKVSVIIDGADVPVWLERSNSSLAYRMPADDALRHLLVQTGPLIAPSANPEGEPPARTVAEAMQYFGEQVDFYVDGGIVEDDTPSQLLRITADGSTERLR